MLCLTLHFFTGNRILESELKTLQKEHSMLKDMVRDLEQIHEQKHSSITQQCGNGNSSNSSNSNNSNSNTSNTKSTNTTTKSNGNGNSSSSSTENGTSASSRGAVSSGSSASASAGTPAAPGVQATKPGAGSSPVKAMLHQKTKPLPTGNASTGVVTSQQPTSKVAAKASNPLVAGATTPGKVSSKSTSTHPPTTPPGTGSSPTGNNVTPSTSVSNAAATVGQQLHQAKDDRKKPICPRAGANVSEKGDGSCVCYYCTLFGQSVCLVSILSNYSI